MSPPPDVLLVNAFGTMGGAERWVLDVLDHGPVPVARAVVLEDGPFVGALRTRGVDVEVLPTGRTGLAVARAAARLLGRLRSAPPDVVLANGVKAATVVALPGRVARVPTVWAKHDFSKDAALARPLGRLATRVVAVSPSVGEATGRDDVVLAPPTVSRPPVGRAEARAELRRHGVVFDEGPVVGMVARLIRVKGVDSAIRTLAQPLAADWRLVVVGPDDPSAPRERERLLALADALGVTRRLHLVGEIPDAGRLLAAFDVVAVLTRADASGFGREGFGLVALEGLRAGVPVVGAEDSPEVARLARRGGRTVPADDPVAIARGLQELRHHRVPDPGLVAVADDHPSTAEVALRVLDVLRAAAVRRREEPA